LKRNFFKENIERFFRNRAVSKDSFYKQTYYKTIKIFLDSSFRWNGKGEFLPFETAQSFQSSSGGKSERDLSFRSQRRLGTLESRKDFPFQRKLESIFYLIIFLSLFLTSIIYAQEQKSQVGIDEKLGQYIKNDISLIDENGNSINISELIKNKPAIITLVYFKCPGICTPLLTSIAQLINKLDLDAGKDFNIITISFDPSENHKLAAEKKANYLKLIKSKQIPEDSWRFLTSDNSNIAKITDAVGFRYLKQDSNFIHSAVVTVVSPDKKIIRYLFGIDFLPFDMKMALIEASEGRVGTTIAKVVTLCFSYNPESRKYTLNVTRVAGGGILVLLTGFLLILIVKKKKKNKMK
jgi:protein SCO1/2